MTDGRPVLGSAFPDDDGLVPTEVAESLASYSRGPQRRPQVLAALADSRLLVPVVATVGEVEQGADGLVRDKTSDMATVLMQGRDGRLALLAFTGSEPLLAWNPQARPVPVATRDAARAALQDGAAALLVDVAGPVRFVIEGPDLQALADGFTVAEVDGQPAWVRATPKTGDS